MLGSVPYVSCVWGWGRRDPVGTCNVHFPDQEIDSGLSYFPTTHQLLPNVLNTGPPAAGMTLVGLQSLGGVTDNSRPGPFSYAQPTIQKLMGLYHAKW